MPPAASIHRRRSALGAPGTRRQWRAALGAQSIPGTASGASGVEGEDGKVVI